MADKTSQSPVISGTDNNGIKTPMNSANIGKGGSPGIYKYPGQQSASSGGSSIKGPGEKNSYGK